MNCSEAKKMRIYYNYEKVGHILINCRQKKSVKTKNKTEKKDFKKKNKVHSEARTGGHGQKNK